jgi:hypothetical protein
MKTTKELMIETAPELFEALDTLNYTPYQTSDTGRIEVVVNGWKCEYHMSDACFKIGHESNHTVDQTSAIKELLVEEFGADRVNGRKNLNIKGYTTIEDFKMFISIIEDCDVVLDEDAAFVQHRTKSFKTNTGILFEGSNFSNAHERSTSIGPRFMKMVCEAAGMNLLNMDAEWGIEDAGRIDGVEMDETEEFPISIYECQSGIQNGNYLDEEHLTKSLDRYPSDPAVSPTLKKIVILAGGYTTNQITRIKWHAQNLLIARKIEVILLQTTRVDNKIGIEVVNYKK